MYLFAVSEGKKSINKRIQTNWNKHYSSKQT